MCLERETAGGWKAPPCQTCPDRLHWLRGPFFKPATARCSQILNPDRFHPPAADTSCDERLAFFHEVGGRGAHNLPIQPRFQTIRQLVNGQKVN